MDTYPGFPADKAERLSEMNARNTSIREGGAYAAYQATGHGTIGAGKDPPKKKKAKA
jgi:hypothetical protein